MWTDMGQKLQMLAKVVFVMGIIVSLVRAIIIWSTPVPVEPSFSYSNNGIRVQANQTFTFWPGLLTLIIGCLLSCVVSWALYGFGLIVKNTEKNNPDDSVEIDPPFQPNWICPQCKAENPSGSVQCQECGRARK